jgi:hypothetical protein
VRYMVMIKATDESEAGGAPSKELYEAMAKYNEELVKAGVMLAGEGLKDSSHGARIRFTATSSTVVDGPFTETKELIAGFWILQVGSRDEAIEWARRVPNPDGNDFELEVRQVFEVEDFPEDIAAQERELRAKLPG